MKLDLEAINFHSIPTKEKEVLSMNEKRVELLKSAEHLAEGLYGDIPYHNFQHAIDAVESGYELIAKCQASGIEVDSDLVRYSLLFHDAGYHEDHGKEGFDSKEEYSAHLAEQSLRSLDIAEETIENVKKCIISTHKDKEFNRLEEKIVRAADLVGLAGDYEQFRKNAVKLREEAEIISGNKISWEDWKKSVEVIIGFYLKQDIKLTECYMDKDGKSIFHNEAKKNLEIFMQENIAI
ncbi:MAG: hypothetical protein ACKUBY_02930 [Candidatus Moraniibacteriota bacterium]|jgi:predicted metal-dependent HD superfamily phosphohydrolase